MEGLLKVTLGIKDIKTELKEGNAKITLTAELPKEVKIKITEDIKEMIPSIKQAEIVTEKPKK